MKKRNRLKFSFWLVLIFALAQLILAQYLLASFWVNAYLIAFWCCYWFKKFCPGWSLFAATGIISLLSVLYIHPVFATSDAAEIIKKNLQISQQAQASWDEAWRVTFMKAPGEVGNGFYFLSNDIATLIAVIAAMFWLLHWVNQLSTGEVWQKIVPGIVLVAIIALYLHDGSAKLNRLTYGAFKVSRYFEHQLLQVQVKGVEINSILNDKLITETAKTVIKSSLSECDNIPSYYLTGKTPAVLEKFQKKIRCYEEVYKLSELLIAKTKSDNCKLDNSCSTFIKWGEATLNRLKAYMGTLQQGKQVKPIAELVTEGLKDTGVKALLFGLQKPWIDSMELGQFIGAMTAPVALALALIPSKGFFPMWLAGFLNLMLLKVYYVVILGIYAFVVSLRPTGVDHGWAWMLGAFAPGLASAATVGGAWTAMKAVASYQAAIALTVINSVASAVTSFFPLMNMMRGKIR